jgi:putative transposase
MDTKFSSGRTRRVYEFIRAQRHEYDVRLMCRLLEVAPSGYYDWLKQPQSRRAAENARLLKLIRASFNASNGIYGSPRVFLDLRELGFLKGATTTPGAQASKRLSECRRN